MARDNIVTFRVTDDELEELKARADRLGYDRRAEYCRDSVLGRTRTEHNGDIAALADRVRQLEDVIATSTNEHADASGPSTNEYTDDVVNAIAAVDLPNTIDSADAAHAVRAARDYIRTHGAASKQEIVRAVMPDYSLGYDVDGMRDKLKNGKRYRGSWWRKVVAKGLEELDSVEKPESSGKDWRWVG